MKIYLHNLGCARNIVDGEVMMGRLKKAGHSLTDDAGAAEAIIVNTCGFIASASEESVDAILELAQLKDEGACRRLIVTGCLPQRYRDDLPAQLPEVDAFLGTGAYDAVVSAIGGEMDPGACLLPDPVSIPLHTRHTMRVQTTYPVAYVKVMEGCNRHCTYCIIPALRGRLRSRPLTDVTEEVASLARDGFPEIVLIGQDTTSWGEDLETKETFAHLLEGAARAAPDSWVRFLYGHPDRIDDHLLTIMGQYDNICPYFDIPIQHASPSVLKRMGRGSHGPAFFRALFSRIRRVVPGAAIRTTVMTGFPGETDSDFNRLCDFIQETRFDHLGAFVYSDAEDLASHRLPDHVPGALGVKRMDILMTLQAAISLDKNEARIGRTVPVLIEEDQGDGSLIGRTMFQAPEVDGITVVYADRAVVGQFMTVRITDATEYDLEGVPE